MPIGERIVDQYGADVADRSSLRRIFATNRGYAGCGTPLKEVAPGQYHPATESVRAPDPAIAAAAPAPACPPPAPPCLP